MDMHVRVFGLCVLVSVFEHSGWWMERQRKPNNEVSETERVNQTDMKRRTGQIACDYHAEEKRTNESQRASDITYIHVVHNVKYRCCIQNKMQRAGRLND